jgi:outer membrane lipoprotein-sorting protein
MPKWTALAIGLSLTAALLALTACGGGDDNATTTVTPTLAPGQTAGPTAEPTDTPSDTGDIASQLAALGNDIETVTAKVTYTDTSSSGDQTTLTIYSKSPNSRYDTVDSDGSSSAYISTPDVTYICSSSADQADQSCFSSPGTGTGSAGLGLFGGFFSPAIVQAMAAAAQAAGIDINKTNETIAGTDATCFEGTESGSTDKFCFSDSGILLETQTTDSSGTSGMVATAVSEDVSDSDFQPPYPVSTLPGQ